MFKAFLKDSVIYAVPAIISRGLTLFLVPLYTRVLSPADYGSLDILMVFAAIVNLTIALEVSQGVARFYAAEKNPERKTLYASSAFWFTLGCYTVFAVLMLLNTNLIAALIMGQSGLEAAFQIGIVYIWINGLFYLTQNQFRWELRSKNYAIVSLLMSIVTAGVSIWLAYGLQWGLTGLLIGMVIGSLSGTVLGLWWLRNSFRLCFGITYLREMLSYSTPLVLSGVAVWVSLYIDRIMINYYLSIDDVGLYGIGYRLASVAGLAMVGFQGALTPLIFNRIDEADTPHQLARIFRFFIAIALVIFIGLSLFSTDLIKLLTTEAFYGGSVVVVYLVPAILISNMYIFAPGIGIKKKTHYLIWINLVGAIVNTVLNYILIPMIGIEGAAIATLLGNIIVFSAIIFYSQKLYYVHHKWLPIFIMIVATCFFAWWIPSLQQNEPLRWVISFYIIIFLAILAFTVGLIHFSELKKGLSFIRTFRK